MTNTLKSNNILKTSLLFALGFFFLLSPFIASSQPTNTGITYECSSVNATGQTVYGDCQYVDLLKAVKKVINWMIIFTLQFSVVVIAWAGFNFMTSGDSASKRTEAKEMLRKVALGIFWVLAAWVVVNLIANTLLTQAVKGVVPIGATP
ncbi:MAG: hypothetical protein AB198_00720 [Parcubacteria bacterium C7867-003]|nr:MAG: hypothetical protein AB198_00720 [Parcubacteria bacterium C7867-003]